MKKLIAILLCLASVATLFSCDEKEDIALDEKPNETEQIAQSGEDRGNIPTEKEPSQSELAQEAYEAILRNERPFIQENEEKIYLQECVFNDMHSRLDEVEALEKALIDMDGDGTEELLIREQGYHGGVILFRYYEDEVYSFQFLGDAMFSINTDGSFRWSYWSSYDSKTEYGESRLTFDGAAMKLIENWRIENDCRWYINGEEVTKEAFDAHMAVEKESLAFSTFVLDRSTWNVGKALAVASKHWGINDGDFEETTGYRYRLVANYHYGDYFVYLEKMVKNQGYTIVGSVLVDSATGEILPVPEAKG